MIKKIIKVLLILIVMVTIFMFSNDDSEVSTRKSDRLIIKVSEFVLNRELSNKEKSEYLDRYFVIVRKTAHFTLYFLLGLTFVSFLKEFDLTNKKLILYTVIFVFLYACSDECHQLFISGRSGEILDVLIDTLGGVTSSIIYTNFRIRRKL
jgi:VanZ family protein